MKSFIRFNYKKAFWLSIIVVILLLIIDIILFDYIRFVKDNNSSYIVKYFIYDIPELKEEKKNGSVPPVIDVKPKVNDFKKKVSSERKKKKTANSIFKVAIIIDDLGQNPETVSTLIGINKPLTFAILPHLHFSKEIATRAKKADQEVILHLPLEPLPSPDIVCDQTFLLTSMTDDEIISKLRKFIAEVPYIKGVNNHMGSMFTSNKTKMTVVLNELKANNLFFIDSRTIARSVAYKIAKDINMRAGIRNVFLDSKPGEAFAKKKLVELVRYAKKTGKAIGIGHPNTTTIKVLQEVLPNIENQGIILVHVSEIVE
ncbi:MAG: divergent polysaccharide deacetylase family protein [bacterium]